MTPLEQYKLHLEQHPVIDTCEVAVEEVHLQIGCLLARSGPAIDSDSMRARWDKAWQVLKSYYGRTPRFQRYKAKHKVRSMHERDTREQG